MGFSVEDNNKQVIEVSFSNRQEKKNYLPSIFNSKNVQSPASQKHLGLILDSKLDFNDHIGSRIIAPASSASERGGILALLQMLEYFSSSSYLLSVKRFFDTT